MFERDSTLRYADVLDVSEERLRRLLAFALDHDVAGHRMRQTPPKTRAEVIQQLIWLGVVS